MLLVVPQRMSDKQRQFPLKYSTTEPRVKSSLIPLQQNGSNFRALICLRPSCSLLFLCLLRVPAKPTPITLQRVGVQYCCIKKDVMAEARMGREEFSAATRAKLQRVDGTDAYREPCHLLCLLCIQRLRFYRTNK